MADVKYVRSLCFKDRKTSIKGCIFCHAHQMLIKVLRRISLDICGTKCNSSANDLMKNTVMSGDYTDLITNWDNIFSAIVVDIRNTHHQ